MVWAIYPPVFTGNVLGPWGVDSIGKNWCVVHKTTLRAKVVGPIGGKQVNYFDRAIALADARNRKELK